jgi:hypothetical protein
MLKMKGASATSPQLGPRPNISSTVEENIAVSTDLVALLERRQQMKHV